MGKEDPDQRSADVLKCKHNRCPGQRSLSRDGDDEAPSIRCKTPRKWGEGTDAHSRDVENQIEASRSRSKQRENLRKRIKEGPPYVSEGYADI